MDENRYIVLLKDQHDDSIADVEKEFAVSVTSSEFLSSENRSFDIINNKNAVLYKNLGLVVVEDVDENQLKHSVKSGKGPILYYEKEREFFAANEINYFNELRAGVENLKQKIDALEKYLREKPLPQIPVVEMEWGLQAIGLDKTLYTGKGIDICILDTGFDMSHPDFAGREIVGKSFIEGEDWTLDVNGHGTHCAGVACGNVRSDTGRQYGVAKDSNLKIAKVLANSGRGTTSSIVDAIDWAISKEFRIVSMSLASPVSLNEKPSILFETVGTRALNSNVLVIAAAGNDSNRPDMPKPVSAPANAVSIMAVGAIDNQMRIARFSNAGLNPTTGGSVDVAAPGVNILSAFPRLSPNDPYYNIMSGTSMATPFVSGLAALYMEEFPDLNAKEIWQFLEMNAKPIENLKVRDVGAGLIQAIY